MLLYSVCAGNGCRLVIDRGGVRGVRCAVPECRMVLGGLTGRIALSQTLAKLSQALMQRVAFEVTHSDHPFPKLISISCLQILDSCEKRDACEISHTRIVHAHASPLTCRSPLHPLPSKTVARAKRRRLGIKDLPTAGPLQERGKWMRRCESTAGVEKIVTLEANHFFPSPHIHDADLTTRTRLLMQTLPRLIHRYLCIVLMWPRSQLIRDACFTKGHAGTEIAC